MPRIRERQEHILIGCSDARDVGQIHIDAVRTVRERYRERGIDAQFHALRIPGATVTDDVVSDIAQIILDSQRHEVDPGTKIKATVHIQTHGVVESSGSTETPHAYELQIAHDPSHNCGMMNATQVALEIENLLLERSPFLKTKAGEGIRIETEQDIRTLLKRVYGFDGYLAGDWIRSIPDLRTHARAQRSRLERRLASRFDLRRVEIHVTAGLQDYTKNRHYRTDRFEVPAQFWDDVHQEIHRLAQAQPHAAAAQTGTQRPIAALFAMSQIDDSPRGLAADWYAAKHGLPARTHGGSLFTLSGASFDAPMIPFGPYALAGIYYAMAHLGVRDMMVLGRTAIQSARMVEKIENDPIAAFCLKQLGGNLLPINKEAILARSPILTP